MSKSGGSAISTAKSYRDAGDGHERVVPTRINQKFRSGGRKREEAQCKNPGERVYRDQVVGPQWRLDPQRGEGICLRGRKALGRGRSNAGRYEEKPTALKKVHSP